MKKPLTRTEKLICVGEWLHNKCQSIFTDRRSQHADNMPVSEGWVLHSPIGGAQMIWHKVYRMATLCEKLKRDKEKTKQEISDAMLDQIVDGTNYFSILLAGLVEDGWIDIPELNNLIRDKYDDERM